MTTSKFHYRLLLAGVLAMTPIVGCNPPPAVDDSDVEMEQTDSNTAMPPAAERQQPADSDAAIDAVPNGAGTSSDVGVNQEESASTSR
jgi:hypothetical protein